MSKDLYIECTKEQYQIVIDASFAIRSMSRSIYIGKKQRDIAKKLLLNTFSTDPNVQQLLLGNYEIKSTALGYFVRKRIFFRYLPNPNNPEVVLHFLPPGGHSD